METSVKRLDIRFVPLDSNDPFVEVGKLPADVIEDITEELHKKLGHICNDIDKCGGFIKVYTLGNSIVGEPQFVNFSDQVWKKIHQFSYAGQDEEDYLDHGNYTDF